MKNIQRWTSHITAGRIGFYLDITLEEEELRDQLGWVESNERLNFYIGQQQIDLLSLAAKGEIADQSAFEQFASSNISFLIIGILIALVCSYKAYSRCLTKAERNDSKNSYVAV